MQGHADNDARGTPDPLDIPGLLDAITAACSDLIGARHGAFIPANSLICLRAGNCTLSADDPILDPTLREGEAVRIADLRIQPSGIAPPRPNAASFLGIPVVSRAGDVLGGLFFTHPDADRFTAEHERRVIDIARYAAIALDSAALSEQARAGAIANARLAAIVQSSDDAIVGKDLNGVIWSWNAGAERMFGYAAEEIIGRPILMLIPPDRPDEEARILERLRRGDRIDHFETERITKDGRRIHVSVTISPIRDPEGRIVGASKVARDITERKRAEAERERLLESERAARAEAERHSRMKDEFLATLGHELRTPLNAVLGWAQLLGRAPHPASELSHGLSVIERNARLQARLIDELLDMSRITSGKLRLELQPTDLAAIIQAALECVRPAADAKRITISTDLMPVGEQVLVDPNRVQQVVWNLLSNAVKFTPSGGRVLVSLCTEGDDAVVRVQDDGEGISPDFLPLVFDRFRQADASTTRRHGGLGLGLAIVRHLVELHGGRVEADSPGPGEGSTFTARIPVRRVVTPADTRAPERPRDAAPGPPSLSISNVHVLLVDDEPDARELVRRLLENAGATVDTAASASEALELMAARRPDVLLSDIAMPGEDGYELLRRVRSLAPGEGGAVPAVALTAFARTEDRRRAVLAGFQMHLPKPVEPDELVAVIASVTQRL